MPADATTAAATAPSTSGASTSRTTVAVRRCASSTWRTVRIALPRSPSTIDAVAAVGAAIASRTSASSVPRPPSGAPPAASMRTSAGHLRRRARRPRVARSALCDTTTIPTTRRRSLQTIEADSTMPNQQRPRPRRTRGTIQSVDRAARILKALASGPRRLGVTELADRLGLDAGRRSTACSRRSRRTASSSRTATPTSTSSAPGCCSSATPTSTSTSCAAARSCTPSGSPRAPTRRCASA